MPAPRSTVRSARAPVLERAAFSQSPLSLPRVCGCDPLSNGGSALGWLFATRSGVLPRVGLE
jgi:hypothetical protein